MATQYIPVNTAEAWSRIEALLADDATTFIQDPDSCPGCGQVAFARKGRLCIACRAEQEADRRDLRMGRY
jgi:NAD-dependent dihydropyrimidine dehydrogenase PreA subunit